MIEKEKIKRINELARKLKKEGLTEEEAAERKALHREYIDSVKENLKTHLEFIAKPGQETTGKDQDELEGNPSHPEGLAGKSMLEEMNTGHREMTDWAFNYLRGLSPVNILDVGCGGGAAIANLLKRFPLSTVYGIDVSDVSVVESIDYNREAVIEGKVRINQGSVEDLPYGDDFFSLVVSISSYFFWDDFKKGLEEIKRVLKPGGTLVLVSAIHKGTEEASDKELLEKDYFKNFLTPEEFKMTLEEIGFKRIKIHTKEGKRWICVICQK